MRSLLKIAMYFLSSYPLFTLLNIIELRVLLGILKFNPLQLKVIVVWDISSRFRILNLQSYLLDEMPFLLGFMHNLMLSLTTDKLFSGYCREVVRMLSGKMFWKYKVHSQAPRPPSVSLMWWVSVLGFLEAHNWHSSSFILV